MIGIDSLIAMRRQGYKPAVVAVETTPSLKAWALSWPSDPGGEPRLYIDASEAIRRIDFRCCIGCTCLVYGTDASRVVAVCEALQAAGANPFGSVEARWGRSEVFPLETEKAA